VYAQDGKDVYVNLFIGGESTVKLDNQSVQMTQVTNYPWDGGIRLLVDPNRSESFAVRIRIPGWAKNRPVPSDLYRYLDHNDDQVALRVNGQPAQIMMEKGYAVLNRTWKKGDVVEISFPMPVRRVVANEKLLDDKNKVALERGPMLFCAEWPDNKDGNVVNLVLPDNSPLKTHFDTSLLNGVQVVQSFAISVRRTLENTIISEPSQDFVAIPYYAWAHRGRGQMIVWPAREVSAARPLPAPTIAYLSKVTASDNRRADAINDQLEPINSIDHTIPFMHWWPRKGTTEWVQYDFKKEESVSRTSIYWFDDTGIGECRLPKSWRLLYKDGDQWKPVEGAMLYEVDKDRYCKVSFNPVKTTGVRVEVQLIPDFSAGIYEWKVE
jgi:hypothetical protein